MERCESKERESKYSGSFASSVGILSSLKSHLSCRLIVQICDVEYAPNHSRALIPVTFLGFEYTFERSDRVNAWLDGNSLIILRKMGTPLGTTIPTNRFR